MTIKERIESNVALFLAGAIVTGFASGWGAHVAVTQQAFVDLVPKGTYVLREDLESGKSSAYIARALYQQLEGENRRLDQAGKQLARNLEQLTVASKDERPYFTMRGFKVATNALACRVKASTILRDAGWEVTAAKEGTEVFGVGGPFQSLINCSARIVFIVGPNGEASDKLRDTFIAGLDGV